MGHWQTEGIVSLDPEGPLVSVRHSVLDCLCCLGGEPESAFLGTVETEVAGVGQG